MAHLPPDAHLSFVPSVPASRHLGASIFATRCAVSNSKSIAFKCRLRVRSTSITSWTTEYLQKITTHLFKEPIFFALLKNWIYWISRWKAGEVFLIYRTFPCHGLLMWYCLSFQNGDLWSGCVDKSSVLVWSVLPQRVPTKSASTTSQLARFLCPRCGPRLLLWEKNLKKKG